MKKQNNKILVKITGKNFIYNIYALTIFLGAFLLFLVQPLMGKYILPWFGGVASVWTVVMLFFQVTLLIGYIYVHILTKHFNKKFQVIIQGILLLSALFFLPIIPEIIWKPLGQEDPIIHILMMLTFIVGLPAIVLSTTSTLIQKWISNIILKKSPYRLYAISNIGCIIALAAFPFILEPAFQIDSISIIWTVVFILYIIIFITAGIYYWKYSKNISEKTLNIKDDFEKRAPGYKDILKWLSLTFLTSSLFLAVTNKICEDISVISLFWILPLGIYLYSFVIAFLKEQKEKIFTKYFFFYWPALIVISYFFTKFFLFIVFDIIFYILLLLFFCLVCHYELVRLKPSSRHLTLYYLVISVGGVLGGIFTGIIAPNIFNTYFEFPLIVTACTGIFIYIFLRSISFSYSLYKEIYKNDYMFFLKMFKLLLLGLLLAVSIDVIDFFKNKQNRTTLERSRNFYGIHRVVDLESKELNQKIRALFSGRINHGLELSQEKNIPTSYYSESSGAGLLYNVLEEENENIKYGVIGLGTGTMFAYLDEGDQAVFYEIDPEVIRLTDKYFSFYNKNTDNVKIILGDARISLENQEPQNFDALFIDAFTGDAIPLHLLTKEAFQIYLKHINENGVIALHISNLHVDLAPVIMKIAKYYNLNTLLLKDEGKLPLYNFLSTWILVSKNTEVLENKKFDNSKKTFDYNLKNYKLWTDSYTSIFKILK